VALGLRKIRLFPHGCAALVGIVARPGIDEQ
jgi:hypothetical protein